MVSEPEPIDSAKEFNKFANMSFILSLIFLPCNFLMSVIAMMGYYALNWHNLDNIIVVFITLTLPLLISTASVAAGIKFLNIKKGYREDGWNTYKAIVGLFLGIIELLLTVSLSVLYMTD